MSGPVIAFDMARAKQAALEEEMAPAPKAVAPVIAIPSPAPKPPVAANTPAPAAAKPAVIRVPSPEKKAEAPQQVSRAASIRARAELGATYAGLLGVETLPADLTEAVGEASLAQDGLSLEHLARGLSRQGLKVSVKARKLDADLWPAIVSMTTGQLVLVLSQDRDMLTVMDPSAADRRSEVALEEFKQVTSGRVLSAAVPIETVEARHEIKSLRHHWFWGEFTKFRRYLAEIALGSFVANVLAVAVALFSLQVYDRVIPHQSHATLWVLAIGAMGALIMEAAIKIARSRLMDGAGRQVELSVQRTLMNRLLGARGTNAAQPSATFSAMREFSSVREFFTASTIGSLADIPFIFVFLALVASIAGNVVWVLVAGGILMVLPGFFLQRKMQRLTEETLGASVKANRLLQEAVYEGDTVKAMRGEARFERVWDELTTLSAVKSSEQRKLAATLTFWSQGVQQATYVAAVVLGTFLVFAGEFTVGSIIAVGILTSRTLAPLTQLAGTMARWSNVKTALDGLDGIANAEQDHDAARSYTRREQLDGRLDLKAVVHHYDPDAPAVLDIEAVQMKPGQRVAVLGSNGSGKSTLLKLLSGLSHPTEGRVQIDGIDMGQLNARDLRRGVGYLAQDVRLFAGTLRDNLNLSQLERDDDRLMAALDFAGLGQFVREHPKGLDLPINDGGSGLSIGQRQSIGWARLWLADPRVVLLDEPTAALDQTLEATLVSRLKTWLAGRTAVIATHRLPILELCDRVLILQKGKLAVDGPRQDVMAHMANARKTKEGA